ncbi:unnamed protein product [Adineta steineri]|uniref:tRNA-specific adenosine deaminase 1 n=1 Tax=Adineta steineri TaxID=433720 RepID=A0A813N7S0_9BILA|nr:unnamed protein product [Adineta steineri]CAF0741687.1 unnamed protein product [Adineta steineri]CAF0751658.1 unnamed protein product [Adineta steineri]
MKRSFEEEEKDDLAERIALSSGFVSVKDDDNIQVLSIGTGTKCLGGDKDERGTQGCLLHDSHAEVIARRALMRFLYEEILNENNSILIKQEKNKFYLNKSICLYLFVSYPPCELAAYVSDPIKRPKFEHKSLNASGEELYLKPGKGFQTTSLSCTNKINRWIYQGIEGTLLNQLILSPIKLSGLIIQTNTDLSSIFKDISVISVKESFDYAWWTGLDPSSSVITADGYPLGQVKKLRHKQQYANSIAKCSLFKLYLQLMDNLSSKTTTYAQAKALSSNSLRNQFMLDNPQWIITDPNIFYSFTLSS